MLSIAIGITMAVLDSSVANIALPAIARQLHAAPAASVWVVNAYQLAVVVSLLPLASLGEIIGYRRVYAAGLALFTAGSLACALSHSLPALVAARIFQGLGAAGIMSVNGALVRHIYPLARLGRGVGLNALVVSIAGALGPSIAAAILAAGRWEWLFAVNVPFGLVNMVLASRSLPASERSRAAFDWTSAALNMLVFGLFFIGVDWLTTAGGERLAGAAAMLAAALAGIVLLRRARTATRPLIPVDLLRIRRFALSVAGSVCAFAAFSMAFLVLPFHFENALHRDQVQTGLLMTPWPVAVGLLGPLAGRLSDRLSPALLGGAGMAILAVGLTLMATLPDQPSVADIVWRMAVCGAGFGLFQSPNNRLMLSTAPRERAGAAGGMLATARLTGTTVGASLAAISFRLLPAHTQTTDLLAGAGLAALAACLSLARVAR